ncbi:hypothetical protein [Polyangium aurulentum]|uniref:hypothetical protein n=1 Tax=Polyangium aurulentum TaxID=2567896 RepID=UPI0010AED74D|nr:hypothetical protein [Polyangium aurulentum]UQA60354.1 hypothetical protein E8A73_007735 [Polyangium aurulentum]
MRTRNSMGMPALVAALALAGGLAAVPACNGNGNDLGMNPTSGSPGDGGGGAGGSGAGGDATSEPHTPEHVWTECQASDQAWVRRAILAIDGRKPWGQAEVNAYTDVIAAVRKADLEASGKFGELGGALPPYGEDLVNARKVVAAALMKEDAFRLRWSDFFMDALHVTRIETKSLQSCYGSPSATPFDNGSLAAWVRDNDPTAVNPPTPGFKMNQLLSSALELDDLSPLYRAHLFAMMSRPYDGANVGPLEMERSRRQNFGAIFEAAYIHRDLVCMSCHNSEFSVTYNEDPSLNRAWPVPGKFEQALYGSANGLHPVEEQAEKGGDEMRARSMLRYMGVADGGGQPAYGWSQVCGTFKVPQQNDPLGVDTYFGSIRSTPENPDRGRRASVWDLERALHRGVDLLAAHGLTRMSGDELADPDEALAYLVAQNVVEKVWAEVMGSRLTIANYFPRTQVQRDVLFGLTEHFIASHFSLKTLLLDILAHPAFNLKAPEEGCGTAAYQVPRLFDPWTISEKDLGKRGNSPGDAVFAISSRPLRRGLHRAMEWPFTPEYPNNNNTEETFQLAIGFFLKDAEPGFRGLDFQGRLVWESVYGTCKPLGANDLIAKIVAGAAASPGATVGDGVVALKDRLMGEPWVDPVAEKAQIEALVGTSLEDTNLTGLDARLRSLCGVLVSTPQFMLGGLVPKDTRDVPKLTPSGISYDATCNYVAGTISASGAPYQLTCGPGTATAKKL